MANKSHWIYWFCCQCHDGGHSPYTTACTDCYHTRCTRCQLHRDKPVPLKRGPTDLQRQEDHSIKAYISQKANIILRDISLDTLKSNHGALSRLTKGLPHMLQTLAIRLAALTEIEPSEDLLAQSRTISQHRHAITLAVKTKCVKALQDAVHKENQLQTLVADPACQNENSKDLTEALTDAEIKTNKASTLSSFLNPYMATFGTSSMHNWWVNTVDFELSHVVPKPSIAEQILSMICPDRNWGNFSPMRVRFELDWDPRVFFKHQQYDDCTYEQFIDQAVILVAGESNTQCTTVSGYLSSCWPHLAELVLDGLKRAGDTRPRGPADKPCSLHFWYKLGYSSAVRCYALGPVDWIAEIGEVLTWLATALRAPAEPCKVMHCSSSMNIVRPDLNTITDRVSFDIFCTFGSQPQLETQSATPGNCWRDMFLNSTIASGYPVPVADTTGLEISLSLLATLVQARSITRFGPRLFLKGFSSMLILTVKSDKICKWHYLFNDDGSRIRYSDSRVRELMPLEVEDINAYESWIGSMRHIVGWCSEVVCSTETAGNNREIERARLEKISFKCAFDRVTISAGLRVAASISAAISKKNKPVHNRGNHYITRLKGVDKGFIIMYDVGDRRAWLMDGASGLLYLVYASLQMDQAGKFVHDSSCNALQLVRNILVGRSGGTSLEILRSDDFLNIRLYKNPDKIEEFEEIAIETTSADPSPKQTVKKVVKKHQSWYCIKDRVEEMCNILEQIFDHQADKDCEDGVGFQIRASSREQLEGFQFRDLASNNAPLRSGVVSLQSEGNSWVDFTRAISAITLFGEGFGEFLKPAEGVMMCSSWTTVPTGRDCLVVPTSVLKSIIRDYAEDTSTLAVELVDNIYWYITGRLFATCHCSSNSTRQQHDDPVQVLVTFSWLERLKVLFRKGKTLPNQIMGLEDGGAIIFGKNSQMPLRWGNQGDPELDTDLGQLDIEGLYLTSPPKMNKAPCGPLQGKVASSRRASETLHEVLKRLRN